VKVDELAEEFLRDYKINERKSYEDVEARWRLHLRPFFGNMRAIHVTTAKLKQYVDERQQQGAERATINRELAALRRMFYIGHESTPRRVLDVPHFPMLKESNARTGFLPDDDFDKLVEGTPLWFRALVECGAGIGWRKEELLDLKVKQLDFEHRILRLEPNTTKNDEGREAPMFGNMLPLL
jgi:integrase